jgi:hypothetical protein
MIQGYPLRLEIPAQGLFTDITDEHELQQFIEKETAFFSRMTVALSHTIVVGQTNYGNVNLSTEASRFFAEMEQQRAKGEFGILDRYIKLAESNRILVGQGIVGQTVSDLLNSDQEEAARWVVMIACPEWTGTSNPNKIISAFRAASLASPASRALGNVNSSEDALRYAVRAKEIIDESKTSLEQFIEEKSKLFDQLEQLYRSKLTLEEPALSWQNISVRKTRVWMTWLAAFAALVLLPIVAGIFYWAPLSDSVSKLTSTNGNGSFSFAGLAIVTVPALLYGWLLKNVSRIFIQNLNLADDAAHRRSLALTYLGLLQNDRHPASDQDRAIILNALFRPIPPQTADEGPPAGVVDLIRNK